MKIFGAILEKSMVRIDSGKLKFKYCLVFCAWNFEFETKC